MNLAIHSIVDIHGLFDILDIDPKPFLWVVLSFSFFYHAIQSPPGLTRRLTSAYSILALVMFCIAGGIRSASNGQICDGLIIGILLNTISVPFIHPKAIHLNSVSTLGRVRVVYRAWTEVRRQPSGAGSPAHAGSRLAFVSQKLSYALIIIVTRHIIRQFFKTMMLLLNLGLINFSVLGWGVLQSAAPKLITRAAVSIYWIWETYSAIGFIHNLGACIFVALLRWDSPEEWSPPFGRLADAYSLRRFWGRFWHKLHVSIYNSFIPAPIRSSRLLRAFFVFLYSAIGHAAGNWVMMGHANFVPVARFFLLNYAIWALETVVQRAAVGTKVEAYLSRIRPLGYLWVLAILFALAPAWQYSQLRSMALHYHNSSVSA
ncbi:hypothetical protein GE09DRAFT_1066803 [Coniochaeta sp. 2T2.1]|nr:hypothetical protein GE09DRAFT_1066803 [Coniochaeta sp. 2T2.1]